PRRGGGAERQAVRAGGRPPRPRPPGALGRAGRRGRGPSRHGRARPFARRRRAVMIVFLSNADTELLALRVAIDSLPPDFPPVRAGNPDRLAAPPSLDAVDVVLVRLLSGRRAWEAPFDTLRTDCLQRGIPLLAFGGEAGPDAELPALPTVDAATLAEAFPSLLHGGPANLANLLRLLAGHPHEPPAVVADTGVYRTSTRSDGPL